MVQAQCFYGWVAHYSLSLSPTFPIYIHTTYSYSSSSHSLFHTLFRTKVFIVILMLSCNPGKCTDTETVPQCSLEEDEDEDYDYDDQTGQREMTKKETEIYYRVVSASQGFDVPVFPNTMAFGRIEPMRDLNEFAEELLKAATLSIEDYNKKNGSNYEVVKIIKANYMGVAGFIFFVTYSVKPADMPADYPITIFQAKVYFGIGPDKIEILICRPKPSEGEKELAGDQAGMPCCC